jgi:hypothetical protein
MTICKLAHLLAGVLLAARLDLECLTVSNASDEGPAHGPVDDLWLAHVFGIMKKRTGGREFPVFSCLRRL